MIGMNKPILIPTPPEELAPAAPPPPYTPEFLDALTAEQRQSPEIREFWRQMHNSGAQYVSWLFWRYQSKVLDTPFCRGRARSSSLTVAEVPSRSPATCQFVEDRQSRRVRSCQIGNVEFDPEERLIARGTELGLDIATFACHAQGDRAAGKRVGQGVERAWPTPPEPWRSDSSVVSR